MRREFPSPSIAVFISLQALDVVTTLIGLRLGASEASPFVSRLMQFGPVTGLFISKAIAAALAVAAVRLRRSRLIVFLNYYFAALITWNLVAIVTTFIRRH